MMQLEQEFESLLSGVVSPSELKSLAITSKIPQHVCIAMSNTSETEAFGVTYVLKIPMEDVDRIMPEIHTGVETVHVHYIESMTDDVLVTRVPPNPEWLVGANVHPNLPNTATISANILRVLNILHLMRPSDDGTVVSTGITSPEMDTCPVE
jgi:hypothetical protein